MPGRRKIFEIKEDNFGMTRYFRLKDYDRSDAAGFRSTLKVWLEDTLLFTQICVGTLVGEDTMIAFVPTSTCFPTVEDYQGEIEFTKPDEPNTFKEDSKTFALRVLPSAPEA